MVVKINPTPGQKKMLTTLLAGGVSLAAAVSGVFITGPSEGLKHVPYKDVTGVATTCFGHTGSIENKKYTYDECLDLMVKDLSKADKDVSSVIHVPLNVYQRASLIDFDYNVGYTNFSKSTMVKMFNEGKYVEGCNQLMRWVYADGHKYKGLEKRRNLELQWCLGKVEIDNGIK